jgi:excisionase family DNA binding protein
MQDDVAEEGRLERSAVHGTMRDSTLGIIKMAMEADDTLADADRKAILAVCRNPILASLKAPTNQVSRLIPISEAASVLSVHPRTVWRLIAKNRLHSVMVGGSRRISTDELTVFTGQGGEASGRNRSSNSAGSKRTPLVDSGRVEEDA